MNIFPTMIIGDNWSSLHTFSAQLHYQLSVLFNVEPKKLFNVHFQPSTINFLYYSTLSRNFFFNVHFQTWTRLTKQTMKVRFKSNSSRQRRNKLFCNWTQHLNWVWKDKLATEKSSLRDSRDINQVQIMVPPPCQKRVSSFQNMIQIFTKDHSHIVGWYIALVSNWLVDIFKIKQQWRHKRDFSFQTLFRFKILISRSLENKWLINQKASQP